ncbi:MAG: arginine--tRNA ligase, partial [Treponema sp.]|nr:arginine--tRNA ligase [Treponema sp.]
VSIILKTNSTSELNLLGEFLAVGPYVNVKFNKAKITESVLESIYTQGTEYGTTFGKDNLMRGKKIMLEFSSPNTNKPLHLGHMRNDALGESVSRILKKAGAEVYKVNIINNRGVHICKSMLAYQKFHEAQGDTPSSTGVKGDHFVGQCYVEFDSYANENSSATKEAEEMLVKWESGDSKVRELWQKMNDWTLSGIKETYERTNISFDKLYFESDTYLLGKEEIEKGLAKGIFFKAGDGSVRIDTAEISTGEKEHEKVLLRKDGTSVYITQDIGTAISRHNDWPFDKMVYVVASEQIHHFKVLFFILQKLGLSWAKDLYHLSYGLVNLPSGRMKSREGTVVDADDLLDELKRDAIQQIKEKGREDEVGNIDEVAEKIALAAIHYYLLQVTPSKDMLFNPQESLSFTGNTGPYIQYMGARISSILRKAKENGLSVTDAKECVHLLKAKEEWELVKKLFDFPSIVEKAANTYDASGVSLFAYDLSKTFSKFYQECPIVSCEDKKLASARLLLVHCTLEVLKSTMDLILVPFVEKM